MRTFGSLDWVCWVSLYLFCYSGVVEKWDRYRR